MSDDSLNPIWNTPSFDLTSVTKVGMLPVRGETRLVPVPMLASSVAPAPQLTVSGEDDSSQVPTAYEAISFAKSTFTDYMTVSIPSRSSSKTDYYEPNFTFRFLINPHTLSISHQTADSQSMTRGGWQFGIWGEELVELHMTGMTAGDYFQNGLTDQWEEYSLSYRNVAELMNVVMNNGYWFEGEEFNPAWNAPDYTRKRIKSHGDVVVSVGNFIWNGMFTNMTHTQSAENPFYSVFDIGFIAWKERFVSGSPWLSAIRNSVYRGHSQELIISSAQSLNDSSSQAQVPQDQADIGSDNTGEVTPQSSTPIAASVTDIMNETSPLSAFNLNSIPGVSQGNP